MGEGTVPTIRIEVVESDAEKNHQQSQKKLDPEEVKKAYRRALDQNRRAMKATKWTKGTGPKVTGITTVGNGTLEMSKNVADQANLKDNS